MSHVVKALLVLALFLLQVLDFFGVTPPDAVLLLKVLSWFLLGYVLYDLSITHVLFKQRLRLWDAVLIVAFLVFQVKDPGFVAAQLQGKAVFLQDALHLISVNRNLIDLVGFYVGSVLLLLVSAVLVWVYKLQPIGLRVKNSFGRFIITWVLLNAVYLFLINLLLEWFVLTVDHLNIVFTVYLLAAFKLHTKYLPFTNKIGFLHHPLEKIATTNERMFKNLINMLHTPKRYPTLLVGILSLHLMTDFIVYYVPSIIGFPKTVYLQSQVPLYAHFLSGISAESSIAQIFSLLYLYVLNALAAFFLFIFPFWMWQRSGKFPKKGHEQLYALFVAGIIVLIFSPAYSVKPMAQTFVGMQLTTLSIANNMVITLVSLAVLIVSVFLVRRAVLLPLFKYLLAIIMSIFVGAYVVTYLISGFWYYIPTILQITTPHLFPLVIITLFFLLSIAFYIVSYVFLLETIFRKVI